MAARWAKASAVRGSPASLAQRDNSSHSSHTSCGVTGPGRPSRLASPSSTGRTGAAGSTSASMRSIRCCSAPAVNRLRRCSGGDMAHTSTSRSDCHSSTPSSSRVSSSTW